MADTSNGFAIEVSLRERFEHHSTMAGSIA
jgi:hypothetical protein